MPGGWVGWAVILTSAAVFIVLNLLRNKDEARRRPPVRRETESTDDDAPPSERRQPITDFDRYLQDFQRRRQAKDGGQQRPKPQPVARLAQPIDRRTRRPAPVPVARPAARSTVDAPLSQRPAPSRNEPIPYAIPVDEAPPPRAIPAPTSVPIAAFPTVPVAATARAIGQAGIARPKVRSDSFVALLQSKQSLRNIMILREILDPPLSKRRRSLGS
jgi:hypothetical protein